MKLYDRLQHVLATHLAMVIAQHDTVTTRGKRAEERTRAAHESAISAHAAALSAFAEALDSAVSDVRDELVQDLYTASEAVRPPAAPR